MYQIKMSLVFIRILREDEDVIDVHPYKDPQTVSKDIVHDAMEGRWRITEANGHNNPLEGAKLRVEGSFLDIFVLDSDLVEPTKKVDLREYGGEASSDPRGHLWVTWGVYLCAGKPPLADIILSHPPDLTRCDSVIGLAIPAMSGHIQY